MGLEQIKEYAKINNVPIMQDEGIDFLTNYIKEKNIKHILEIGSAIGYSAIKMALVSDDIYITTIERDEVRYKEAIKNIETLGLQNRIEVIFADALEVELDKKYDLLFIDAAKGQNIKFFNRFQNNLNEKCVIITDNIDFHGLVESHEKLSRNLRQLIRKIKEYIEFLENNEEYETTFHHIGDGISISVRK